MTDRYIKLSDTLRVLGSYSQDEMSDYIKRSDALDSLYAEALIYNFDSVQDGDAKRYARAAQRCIARIPTANVVEVVRCKDCKLDGQYIWCQYFKGDNGYCPRGRRG